MSMYRVQVRYIEISMYLWLLYIHGNFHVLVTTTHSWKIPCNLWIRSSKGTWEYPCPLWLNARKNSLKFNSFGVTSKITTGVFSLANNFRKYLSSSSNWCFVDADSHSNRSDSFDFKPFHETMREMRGFKMGSLNINSLVKHIDELRVVSLPRTCLKCLPIAPLFMIMDLRSSRTNLALPKRRTDFYGNNFAFTRAKIWNDLPNSLKEETSLRKFKSKLDHYYQHQQN